jgi:hypothetical protein
MENSNYKQHFEGDIPYSVEKRNGFFDWNEFLNRETYTVGELAEAYVMSTSWTTCACGNLCSIIPRKNGKPVDESLHDLGECFCSAIMDMYIAEKCKYGKESFENHREHAKNVLERIEKRSTILIKEILEKQSHGKE